MNISDNNLSVSLDLTDTTAEQDATYEYTHFDSVSDAYGNFSIYALPTVTITFGSTHSSAGFTFFNTNIDECDVSWYGHNDEILATELNASTRVYRKVLNYQKIVIAINKIHGSNTTATFGGCNFGIQKIFSVDAITQGSVVENSDPISNQLLSNQFTFSMIDPDDEFNLGNPEGLHQFIQAGQTVIPTEWFKNKSMQMGVYFINSFSVETNLVKFNCVDLLTMLDKVEYGKGTIYSYESKSAGYIIEDIFSLLPQHYFKNYVIDIDDDLYVTQITDGALKPMSGRQALREVLFAIGAMCIPYRDATSYRGGISIVPIDRTIKHQILKSQKMSTKVSKKDYVSAVTIKYTTYNLVDEIKDFKTETFPAGDTVIDLSTPYVQVSATVGTIVSATPFRIKLRLSQQAEVTLSGKEIKSTNKSLTASRVMTSGQEVANEVSYNMAVGDGNLAVVKAQQVLQYLFLRLQVDTQYISDEEINIGDFMIIQNPNEDLDDYVAGVETLTIDLSGGFVTTAKLVGFFNSRFEFYRTGIEIIADDNIIM